MKTYKIFPLDLGRINRDTSSMGYMQSPGTRRDYPVLAWYVTDGERHILVDTGGEPATGQNRAPYTQTKLQHMEVALQALRIDAQEIQFVVLTHLHWDHAGNNTLFPNAKFYVQRAELQHAIAPVPSQKNSYVLKEIVKTNYEILEGDTSLFDGISVCLTPGHTPGSQTVLVQGKSFVYGLVGDLFSTCACWEAVPPIPNGWLTSLEDYAVSIHKLRKIPNFKIMPSHDMELLKERMYD